MDITVYPSMRIAHLTTFITPSFRYRNKTASQGYIVSGDGYTRRYDEIVAEIQIKLNVWMMFSNATKGMKDKN